MCGIFGLIVTKQGTVSDKIIKTTINTLFSLSESRGKEASGIAVSSGSKTRVLKAPTCGTKFIQSNEFTLLINSLVCSSQNDFPCAIIGHTRLATNGAWSDNSNNQPIVGKSSVIIHNGIIVNTDQVWKKHPSLHKKLDIDTEILIQLYERYVGLGYSKEKAVRRVYREIKGAATIAILETESPVMLLATNTGSLYCIKKDGLFLFASEEYIIRTLCGSILNFNAYIKNVIHYTAGSGLSIALTNLTVSGFSLFKTLTGKQNCPKSIFHRPVKNIPCSQNLTIFKDQSLNSIASLKAHFPDYDAICRIRRCSRCIMPETMPLIQFDENGLCNFCRTYKKQAPVGAAALQRVVEPFRSKTKEPNCIVALSGGRDSSYGLHYAKNVLKLNPIAYTYDWGMVTDIARRNQSLMTAALGVEHIVVSADINKKLTNIKKNVEAWLAKPDLGMVTLLMAGDKQAEYYAEELKRKTGIKLVIYCRGNQIEDERFKFGYYGIFDGTPGGVIHNLSFRGKLTMLGYYAKQFMMNPKYINSSLVDTAWAYASAYLMRHDFVYLWHYIGWDEGLIVSTLRKLYNWETPKDTIATWRIDDGTPAFYNYIYYKIQGFTEHDGLRSNQVRESILSRSDALNLVNEENKPRYEALKWYFDRIGMDGNKVLTRIDSLPVLYQPV